MNPVHVQHTEWLTEQLRYSQNKLVEAQNTVTEAKQNIAYIREMLKLVNNVPGTKDSVDTNQANTKDNIDNSETNTRRTPKQMLLPVYADMPIREAIYQYLLQLKTEVPIDDLSNRSGGANKKQSTPG